MSRKRIKFKKGRPVEDLSYEERSLRETLFRMYWTEHKSTIEMAEIMGLDKTNMHKLMWRLDIQTRTHRQAALLRWKKELQGKRKVEMGENTLKIKEIIDSNPGISPHKIANKMGMTYEGIKYHLKKLGMM